MSIGRHLTEEGSFADIDEVVGSLLRRMQHSPDGESAGDTSEDQSSVEDLLTRSQKEKLAEEIRTLEAQLAAYDFVEAI